MQRKAANQKAIEKLLPLNNTLPVHNSAVHQYYITKNRQEPRRKTKEKEQEPSAQPGSSFQRLCTISLE